jgi:hypothetical protein
MNFWIVESFRIALFPKYGSHWHIIFAMSRPQGVKVVAGPFATEDKAIDWLNSHVDDLPKPL